MHAMQGTYRRDRHGEPGEAWKPAGEPQQPAWLSAEGQELWQQLVPLMTASGIVGELDAPQLAAMCDWWGRYRQASIALEQETDHAGHRAYRALIMSGIAWNNFNKIACRFGLSPADREALRLLPRDKHQSELEQFLESKRL